MSPIPLHLRLSLSLMALQFQVPLESDCSTRDLPSTIVFSARHPLVRYSLGGAPHPGFLAIPSQGKWDNSSSGSPDHHTKRTHICSPEGWEWAQLHMGDDYLLKLTPETGTGSGWQRQESFSPSSSPIRGLANPDDEAVTGSSKSTRDQTSSDSGSSRGKMVDSDLDTASRDCLSCSDTDEVSVQTT